MNSETHDVVVIGGSIAGLSAALQLARARRKVLVVDASKPRNRFASASHGFFGHDGKNPFDMIREATRQLLAYPGAWIVQAEAVAVSGGKGDFTVEMSNGDRIGAARVILATGLRDELPDIPGLSQRWGQSVFHCPYCHGYEWADSRLGVIASHEKSVHQAILLADWGRVTFFSQGRYFASGEEQALLESRNVITENTPVVTLYGEGMGLDAVRLEDGRILEIQAVLVAPKLHMASPLAAELGCAFEEGVLGDYIKTDPRGETSVPGVFAAGDAAIPMQNATLASASGVMAGTGAHQSLIFD